jgi:hypothetical protein
VAAPLLAPASEAGRLTAAFQAVQARRAAAIAALVVAYYRTRVDVENPRSVDDWLRIMIPRIMREHNLSAQQAASFGSTLRRLEVPDAPPFSFTPATALNVEQIRTSLSVVGPTSYAKRSADIRRLDEKQFDARDKQAMLRDLNKATEVKIAGSVARHTQNGARETLLTNVAQDKTALGWVRVTRDKPCYFCALLAGRGLQKGYTYSEDSFEGSDSRFVGSGNAKVHDHCQCHIKPVYLKNDDYVQRAEFFEALYRESDGSINGFRRVYDTLLAAATTTN